MSLPILPVAGSSALHMPPVATIPEGCIRQSRKAHLHLRYKPDTLSRRSSSQSNSSWQPRSFGRHSIEEHLECQLCRTDRPGRTTAGKGYPHTKSMWVVFWILVRPVEIGSRCHSADAGSDSGYSLLLKCFEQNEFEESISSGS